MSENSRYNRGLEWRKWDMHVHSPKVFLNNQFGSTSNDDFVNKISESGIVAVGLTNYFRFDDAELGEIKDKLNKKGIVVFPNNVALGTQIYADDNRGYSSLDGFYALARVNHSAGEYVREEVHTNSIESVWALVKRVYIGIHHHWSKKHMQRYLNSCTFRLNRKNMESEKRVAELLEKSMHVRLTYKGLTR